ncbi:NmrA family NAD(P)-binding protein [Chryseobacterium paridis]|uniref:NAD(P)H-binding protein n=1 Tax=Chryseobacterium paridis TaxID=2800328 RepID=A0ABS1FZK6_9FLAO|nr:NAD(P)H-binding protein [Chryseobacterium paridis]MBK1897619.1 NAD(P)H-binding protein [Chryseobacterium paridis]
MKIVVTGSLGNISKPLTQLLVSKGHSVTVVSTNPERKAEIENLGAQPAIGTMEDVDFLSETFKGADIVYAMEALNAGCFFDHNVDFIAANTQIGKNYKEAFERSGVKRIVHLSSIGAHMSQGNGILAFHHNVESILKELPEDVSIKFMRPVAFYYNMYAFIPDIKAQGKIIQNYGGDQKEPWVSPLDIAEVIAEEIEKPFNGREIRYIASEEIAPNEIAGILGEAIGNNELKWEIIPDEQMLDNLIHTGMNPQTAKGFIEMNAAMNNGTLSEDYYAHQPALGKIKVKDFAKEFAITYHQ